MVRKTNLWLVFVLVVALGNVQAPSSVAASCKSESNSGSVKLGSKVTGDTVTICASRDWLKKIIKTAVVPVKLPPSAKPSPKPIAKPVAKPVTKPKTKTKKLTSTKKRKAGNTAVFRAMRPLATRTPLGVLAVKQSATFRTALKTKVSKTVLLGQNVQVRFTPTAASWSLGDGATATGTSFSHAYSARGSYLVRLKVKFTVEYRAIGGAWLREPTPIWLSAPALNVPVGVTAEPADSGPVVLVRAP